MTTKKSRLPITTESTNQTDIILSSTQEDEVLVESLVSYLVGVVTMAIPPIGFLVSWRHKREERKREEVLKRLKVNVREQGVQIASITNLLKNPKGLILFNKILFLARLSEPEDDDFANYADLLSLILVNISSKEFESLFDQISYLISRIEKLSPQALFLLSDSHNWPKDSVGGTTMSGYTLSGEGLNVVARGYLRDKNIDNESIKPRVLHAFGELQSGGFMIFSADSKRASRTAVADEIYNFLLTR